MDALCDLWRLCAPRDGRAGADVAGTPARRTGADSVLALFVDGTATVSAGPSDARDGAGR